MVCVSKEGLEPEETAGGKKVQEDEAKQLEDLCEVIKDAR
jgi:hypothetical protein